MAHYLGRNANDSGDYFFISYKSKDIDKITEILSEFNFDVWYDDGIEIDEWWPEVIANHIEGCKAFIFFMSKAVLEQGVVSYPINEYDIAVEDYHKKIIVVYLDKITPDDVPASVKQWYKVFTKKQGIDYEGEKTTHELSAKINEAAKNIILKTTQQQQKPDKLSAPVVSHLETHIFSNYNKNTVRYLGYRDSHLSSDASRICLYNSVSKDFEVHDTSDINHIIARFKEKPKDISNRRLYYSSLNKYIYHVDDEKVYIFDIAENKWKSSLFKKFSLAKDEKIYGVAQPPAGNHLHLLVKNSKYFTRVIKYDIENNVCEKELYIEKFKYCSVLQHLQNNNHNSLLFSNTESELCLLDLTDGKIYKAKDNENMPQFIQSFIEEEEDVNAMAGTTVSRDGLLYSVGFDGGYEVYKTETGSKFYTVWYENIQNSYLLKNRTVLEYSKKGTVSLITAKGTASIFTEDYFTQAPEFGGKIPHTLCYDETNGCFIFIVDDKNGANKAIVVDKFRRVIAASESMNVPFPSYYCDCVLTKEKIFVLFSSADSKHEQSTIIYTCDY